MIDKFLFIEDLKGENGEIARDNAFEELELILDEEIECDMCDDKDAEIKGLERDVDDMAEHIKKLEIENKMLKEGFTVVK